MNTTDQQALAAFIESCPGLKWQFRSRGEEYKNKPWANPTPDDTPRWYLEYNAFDIRIVQGQLTFGVPLSMAHLIHNPAGLSEEEITEGGKWRVKLVNEDLPEAYERWSSVACEWVPRLAQCVKDRDERYTCRLPAYHPLPKVESNPLSMSDKEMLDQVDSLPILTIPESFDDKPAAEETPTPRTDAQMKYPVLGGIWAVDIDFARTLERELAAERKRAEEAEAQIVALRGALGDAVQPAEIAYDWNLGTDGKIEINGEWVNCYSLKEQFETILSAQPPSVKEEKL